MVIGFLTASNKVHAERRTPAASTATTNAQRAPDCKISSIKIVPFDSLTGKFREEVKPNEDPGFFNEFRISLFVVVEISSQAYFEVISVSDANKNIKVEITVMEGQRLKTKKLEQISLHNLLNGGKIFVPLWLDPLMCGDVKIDARIIGQKSVSTMRRTVPFSCGE
jgi:hypothetical protein